MQEKCKIQNQRVGELLEQFAIRDQLRLIRHRQCIEFVDAYQSVLVRRIPVQKLMLHKAGELTEFGNVSAKKIDAVHHSQDAPHSPFVGENRFENHTWPARILIRPSDMAQASAQQVFQLRAEIEVALLGKFKGVHHLLRVVAKHIATRRMQLFVSNKERVTNRSLVGLC